MEWNNGGHATVLNTEWHHRQRNTVAKRDKIAYWNFPWLRRHATLTTAETEKAVRILGNKKAPGHDLVEPEMVKQAWPVMQKEFNDMFNKCLQDCTFPRQWKRAEIKILLKGADKPAESIKFYRPISLLPILGKILENRIQTHNTFSSTPNTSSRQYGFKLGNSTEDAIIKLREITLRIRERYAMIDISRAFDGVWWPSVLYNLEKRNCPKNIHRLIQSYLFDREAGITSNTARISKRVSKGSVLGPQLWNIIFDEIIEEITNPGICQWPSNNSSRKLQERNRTKSKHG